MMNKERAGGAASRIQSPPSSDFKQAKSSKRGEITPRQANTPARQGSAASLSSSYFKRRGLPMQQNQLSAQKQQLVQNSPESLISESLNLQQLLNNEKQIIECSGEINISSNVAGRNNNQDLMLSSSQNLSQIRSINKQPSLSKNANIQQQQRGDSTPIIHRSTTNEETISNSRHKSTVIPRGKFVPASASHTPNAQV